MTELRMVKAEYLKELFGKEPGLEKHVKEPVLVMLCKPKSHSPDPLLQVEISLRKCERLGVFEK